MKKVNQIDISQRLNDFESKGFHIDSRLKKEINKDGTLYLIGLEDEHSFLSLIWQESDPARLLTPSDESRCLKDIAKRFIKNNYSFSQLAKPMGLPVNQHHPEWFEKCIPINDEFNYANYGLISIVPAIDNERNQSPDGSFYIYDGIHKSLVLATKLLKKEIAFQKIEALLLIPRR